MPDKGQSFWTYFVPIFQSSIDNARGSLEEGDEEYAEVLLDNAKVTLDQAREQTEKQIAERDEGTYDPINYREHWADDSKVDTRHLDKDAMYEREEHEDADW